jgi:hypothetical protein
MFFSRKISWTKNDHDEKLILKEENKGPISGVTQ